MFTFKVIQKLCDFFFKDNFNPPKVWINLSPREKGEIVLSDEGREL